MEINKAELKEKLGEKKSIMHIQNVLITKPIQMYISRETMRYIIGYEIKAYSKHSLLFKIDKELINETKNPMKIEKSVDINIQENYRLTIKSNDEPWKISSKNIVVRIVTTRYSNLKPLYGMIVEYGWRHTGAGGRDMINFKIQECPIISNSETVTETCYKLIGRQISNGGTHGTHTYVILSPQSGNYEIGTWLRVSNQNRGGHQHSYEWSVSVSL